MMDIDMGELELVLNTNSYSTDEGACEEYIKEHARSSDGRAYARTAAVAIRILNGEV